MKLRRGSFSDMQTTLKGSNSKTMGNFHSQDHINNSSTLMSESIELEGPVEISSGKAFEMICKPKMKLEDALSN